MTVERRKCEWEFPLLRDGRLFVWVLSCIPLDIPLGISLGANANEVVNYLELQFSTN